MRPQPFYHRHSTVSIEEVLAEIQKASDIQAESKGRVKYKAELNGVKINVTSLRLRTFLTHGTTCSCCGLKATYFAIERNRADEAKNGSYHINLWGANAEGEDVLFTMDHTIARSLGGADDLTNTTPMCTECNFEKSIGELEELKKKHPGAKT